MKNILFTNIKTSAIIMLLLAVFISSCKVEEVDDQNIEFRSINKSVTSVVAYTYARDSADLNGDGRIDIYIAAAANPTADTALLFLSGNHAAVYVDSTETYSAFYYKAKNLFKDQSPDVLSAKRQWWQNTYVGLRQGSTKKGYAGVGDVFIPFIFNKVGSPDYYYGWLRVNVSSDYRTIKLIDAAYHVLPDTPIKMGAK